jgi:hypothetical protein
MMIKSISLVTVATFFIEMVVGETWRALTGWKALRFQVSNLDRQTIPR